MYHVIYDEKQQKWIVAEEPNPSKDANPDTLFHVQGMAENLAKRYNEGLTIKCRDCGEYFGLSPEEQEWYVHKGFKMPKRCPDCRFNRREEAKARADEDQEYDEVNTPEDANGGQVETVTEAEEDSTVIHEDCCCDSDGPCECGDGCECVQDAQDSQYDQTSQEEQDSQYT